MFEIKISAIIQGKRKTVAIKCDEEYQVKLKELLSRVDSHALIKELLSIGPQNIDQVLLRKPPQVTAQRIPNHHNNSHQSQFNQTTNSRPNESLGLTELQRIQALIKKETPSPTQNSAISSLNIFNQSNARKNAAILQAYQDSFLSQQRQSTTRAVPGDFEYQVSRNSGQPNFRQRDYPNKRNTTTYTTGNQQQNYSDDDHPSGRPSSTPRGDLNYQQNESKNTMENDESKQSYFWDEKECVDFIKLMHLHGKRWIVLSQHLQGRNQLQCRSHGQKYLKAHRELLTICENMVDKNIMPSDLNLLRIKRYEQDCKNVLESFRKDMKTDPEILKNIMRKEFFPNYMVNHYILEHRPQIHALPDKLEQIRVAVANELSFYDDLKTLKKRVRRGSRDDNMGSSRYGGNGDENDEDFGLSDLDENGNRKYKEPRQLTKEGLELEKQIGEAVGAIKRRKNNTSINNSSGQPMALDQQQK
eukprot:403347987